MPRSFNASADPPRLFPLGLPAKDQLSWTWPMRIHAVYVLAGALMAAGCASHGNPTSRPADALDRQDAALQDPFGYSPGMNEQDISGGDLGHLDKKALERDVDHVLNP
jgi:hypothetical protein